MIKTHHGEKLAGHVSRDSTAIHAREKAEAKPKAAPKPKRGKRGRRSKNASPAPPPDPTRLQLQLECGLQANLADTQRVEGCTWMPFTYRLTAGLTL